MLQIPTLPFSHLPTLQAHPNTGIGMDGRVNVYYKDFEQTAKGFYDQYRPGKDMCQGVRASALWLGMACSPINTCTRPAS